MSTTASATGWLASSWTNSVKRVGVLVSVISSDVMSSLPMTIGDCVRSRPPTLIDRMYQPVPRNTKSYGPGNPAVMFKAPEAAIGTWRGKLAPALNDRRDSWPRVIGSGGGDTSRTSPRIETGPRKASSGTCVTAFTTVTSRSAQDCTLVAAVTAENAPGASITRAVYVPYGT